MTFFVPMAGEGFSHGQGGEGPSPPAPALEQTTTNGNLVSPSLLPLDHASVAHELKFLLPATKASEVDQWAREHLALDPHGDPALGHAYRIESLYFDTLDFAVFHQWDRYRRRKYRIRRYGQEPLIYLERKTKSGSAVSKRRSPLPVGEAHHLASTASDETWPGHWFHRRLLSRGLKPRCRVRYERLAFMARTKEGPVRLTMDRGIHCASVDGLAFDDVSLTCPLFSDQVILELKFHNALPMLFKDLLSTLRLHPSRVSKYRQAIAAMNLAAK